MTPSEQHGGRGVRGILNDILHGRDDDHRLDEAVAEGAGREADRYGTAHPDGPQGEQPPRPRPGPTPDAGAHRLAEQTGGDALFGTPGQERTFGPRSGSHVGTIGPDGPRAGSNLSWARPGDPRAPRPGPSPWAAGPGAPADPVHADPWGADDGPPPSTDPGGVPVVGDATTSAAGTDTPADGSVAGSSTDDALAGDARPGGGAPEPVPGDGPTDEPTTGGGTVAGTPDDHAPDDDTTADRTTFDDTTAADHALDDAPDDHAAADHTAADGGYAGTVPGDSPEHADTGGDRPAHEATVGRSPDDGAGSGRTGAAAAAVGGAAAGMADLAAIRAGRSDSADDTRRSDTVRSTDTEHDSNGQGSNGQGGYGQGGLAGSGLGGTHRDGRAGAFDTAAEGSTATTTEDPAEAADARGSVFDAGDPAGDTAPEGAGDTAPVRTGDDLPASGVPHSGTGTAPVNSAGHERLVPLDRAQALSSRWDAVKGSFVDEPRDAVRSADALVGELLDELDRLFREQRSALEHGLDTDETTTEDLRLALRRYRSFFDRLIDL